MIEDSERKAFIERALQETARGATPALLLKSLLVGSAAGAGVAGLREIGKVLKRSQPVPVTYTQPVDIDVYSLAKAKKKRQRKLAAGVESPATRQTLPSQLQTGVVNPGDLLKFFGATAVGAVGGYKGSKWLASQIARTARRRQLAKARSEFEATLQDMALPVVPGSKVASDPLVVKLAINCTKLAIDPMIEELLKYLPLVAAGAVGTGAYVGYKQRMQNSKRDALQFAENRVNMEREQTNPTFALANLKTITKDMPDNDRDEARQRQDEMLSDYPYL